MLDFLTVISLLYGIHLLIAKSPLSKGYLYITGIIGIPVHELGHYLMCKLMGFRVTGMKLFQPRSPDGILGYVNYAYPVSLYGAIGKVLVSLGPLLTGFTSVYFLSGPVLRLLYNPHAPYSMDIAQFVEYADWMDWLFVYLLTSVCFHTLPSGHDIKIAAQGSVPVAIVSYLVIVFFGINASSLISGLDALMRNFSQVLMLGVLISLPAAFFALLGYVGLILNKLLYKANSGI